MMQLDQILTFLDLCETRSFHRSADRMGVTQSTVSARLKGLEQALGAPLFTRSRAGTDLTTEGLRFEPHARALRAEWAAARHSVDHTGARALVLRLGLQHDLAASHLADWAARFQSDLPGMAIYFELDYSNQMCSDLIAGALDFAVLFTPRPHPDLHFTGLGDIRYRMISTYAETLAEIDLQRYVLGNYAPAFETAHRRQLPHLIGAPVTVGRSDAAADMILKLGASGYVFESTANHLSDKGKANLIADAPVLTQPAHAAMPLRLRSARLQSRLLKITREQFRLWY